MELAVVQSLKTLPQFILDGDLLHFDQLKSLWYWSKEKTVAKTSESNDTLQCEGRGQALEDMICP